MKRQTLDVLADAVADRILERLGALLEARDEVEKVPVQERPADQERWLTATEVAARFSVDRGWIYEHADELGAIRLGDGERPRLRFSVERVADALVPRPSPVTAPRRREPKRSTTADLLPIRGER